MNKISKYISWLGQCILKRSHGTITAPVIPSSVYSILEDKLSRCPCSTKYHGAYPGGLVDHLLNVTNLAISLANLLKVGDRISTEELSLCALVHDLGKLGNFQEDFYLPNPDLSKRDKEPYIVNTKLVSIPHEIRSLYWIDKLNIRHIDETELQAICYHAGPYTPGYLESVRKESLLLVLLHTADNLSTKVIES